MAGLLQRGRSLVAAPASICAVQLQIGEEPVAAVDARASPSGSPSIGISPRPCLPVLSAISCSSQAPRSAIPGEAMIVTLSRPNRLPRRPWRCRAARRDSPPAARPAPQARTIGCAVSRKRLTSMPDRRGRHQTELRQHRVAAADRGHAVEDIARSRAAWRDLLQRRAGIGHGDEMLAGLFRAAARWRRGRRNSP